MGCYRSRRRRPASVASWPVQADKPLNCAEGTFPLEYVLAKGYKHWLNKAAEARSIAGLAIYLAWAADTVKMARKLGFHEKDPYWALLHVLDEVREGKTVEVFDAEWCYVHRAGAPGKAEFLARMRPMFIVRSWEALQQVEVDDRASHWLNTVVDGPGGSSRPLWKASPYLLVGDAAWDTDTADFPEPSMTRYGRVGAPGSPWWIAVHGHEAQDDCGDSAESPDGDSV
jgi:hypothetical protein